jgi:VirE N-terminal domain/Primase C terminal 2 (PriCT-2)
MDSVLNKIVSCYRSASATEPPKDVNLLTWLNSPKHKERVDFIRLCESKEQIKRLKKELPCITVSGQFGGKTTETMITYTGLVAIDVDNVANIQATKKTLCELPYVAYCGLSVSGKGLFAIIPLTETKENFKFHFRAIREEMKGYGIEIDNLSDYIRFRYYSYDIEPYFNHNATKYTKMLKPDIRYEPVIFSDIRDGIRTTLEVQIANIEAKGIDLTVHETDWFIIGCALVKQFGEGGRHYFHRLSMNNPEYNYEICNKKYTHILSKGGYRYTIASLMDKLKPYI